MKYLSALLCSALLIACCNNISAMETKQKISKNKSGVYITLDPTPIEGNADYVDAPWWGQIVSDTGIKEFDEICDVYGFHEVSRDDKNHIVYFKCGSDYWNNGSLKETAQAMRDLRKLSCVKSVKFKEHNGVKVIETTFEPQAFDQLSFEVMECARVE